MLKNVLLSLAVMTLFSLSVFESGTILDNYDTELNNDNGKSEYNNVLNTNDMDDNEYILIIPKINLYQKFYPFNLKKNKVKYGIQTIFSNQSYDKKDELNNVMLASHSGTGKYSYFHNLEKLEINDEVYINHGGINKKYLIIVKEYKEKDGHLSLYKKYDDFLILITCSNIKKDLQVYYIAIKS